MSETAIQIDALLETARREGYAQGAAEMKRKIILQAADELNGIINRVWLDHERVLKQWAQELGQRLHTAIPDRDVGPLKNSAAE
jgi:hypothetical protein